VTNVTASARMGDTLGLGHCRTTSWSSASSLTCQTGYGWAYDAHDKYYYPRSTVTISSMVGTTDQTFFYQGCDCSEIGSFSGRCTSGTVGGAGPGQSQCNCRSNYTNNPAASYGSSLAVDTTPDNKCRGCSKGYIFDPHPWCKSGDCRVTTWTSWSSCSRTCGSSDKMRSRTIDWKGGRNGGAICPALNEFESCVDTIPCPGDADCVLSPWGGWTSCDSSCGYGIRLRERAILSPATRAGLRCPMQDSLIGKEQCNTFECPVDCQVGGWSAWSACGTSCGVSTSLRSRTISVATEFGGAVCPQLSEQRSCSPTASDGLAYNPACPVDCAVSSWVDVGECSATCDGGRIRRQKYVMEHV
jgi:hypothetical protein